MQHWALRWVHRLVKTLVHCSAKHWERCLDPHLVPNLVHQLV